MGWGTDVEVTGNRNAAILVCGGDRAHDADDWRRVPVVVVNVNMSNTAADWGVMGYFAAVIFLGKIDGPTTWNKW